MIAIIDYGVGNLKSVEKAFSFLGYNAKISKDVDFIKSAKAVVLPGVGAFSDAMKSLKNDNLINCIYDVINKKTMFLGICLGLQLIFETSEEGGKNEGLSILKGNIIKIPEKYGLKVPQMGWNKLDFKNDVSLFEGLCDGTYTYFVHSYYLDAKNKNEVCATTDYGVTIDAAIAYDNIFATQFHPEKSGRAGLKILENFVKKAGCEKV